MQDGDHLHKTHFWGYILFIYMFCPNRVLIKTRTASTYGIFNTPPQGKRLNRNTDQCKI